jgi:hypothetical protein
LLVGAAAAVSILGVAQTTAAAQTPPDGTGSASAEAAACASLYGVRAQVFRHPDRTPRQATHAGSTL